MFSLVSRCFSPGVTLSFLFLSMACYVCVFHPECVANPPPFSCWYCKGTQFFFGPLPWVLSGHLISMMFCRHLLINTCIVLVEVTVDLHVSDTRRKTDFTFELRFWFLLMLSVLLLQIGLRIAKACRAFFFIGCISWCTDDSSEVCNLPNNFDFNTFDLSFIHIVSIYPHRLFLAGLMYKSTLLAFDSRLEDWSFKFRWWCESWQLSSAKSESSKQYCSVQLMPNGLL